MGNENSKMKKNSNILRYKTFINGKTKTFNSKSEFNLLLNKKKSHQLYQELSNIKDINKKIGQFNEILSLNNYDENIIYDYLSLLKQIENNKNNENNLNSIESNEINMDNTINGKKAYHEELTKYSICLSKDKYWKLEKKEKKSSKELLYEFFQNLYNFHGKYNDRANFYNYLNNTQILLDLKLNFTEKENEELYIYFLFYNIFQIFKNKMNSYIDPILESKKNIEEKISTFLSNSSRNEILKMNVYSLTDGTLILYSKFFELLNVSSLFIRKNIHIINSIFNSNNNIDFYILEGILLITKSQITYGIDEVESKNEKLLNDYFSNKIEELKIDKLNQDFIHIKIAINGENLDIISEEQVVYTIENYKMYNNLEIPLYYIDLYIYQNESIFIKYYLIDYIKLQYFQENNYVKYSLGFINYFHDKISKSKTIISLVNNLFPGFEKDDFLSDSFILSLFSDSLKNAKFYPFETKIYCTTFYHSLFINYQIENKIKLKERNANLANGLFKYIILNLSFFIICEYHEVLGHYLREYLKLLTNINYLSPRDENNNKESGSYIQYLLFDNKVEFNLIELLYILDYTNYNVDYNNFNKNFKNLNLEKYEPSNEFKISLEKYFGIQYKTAEEIIKQDIKKNVKYNLFGNLKNDVESYKFEMHTPCSLNLEDSYIENKKHEKIYKKIMEELKKQEDLFLSKEYVK